MNLMKAHHKKPTLDMDIHSTVIEVKGRKTVVTHDKVEKIYTFSLLEKGGPIITGEDYEDTRLRFIHALNVAESVVKLINFSKS